MNKNDKVTNWGYKIAFVSFIIYSLISIGKTFYINIQLALLFIPLTMLVYYVGYKYISPKELVLPRYCSLRNKASYLFLLFIIITLNYIPSSEIENYTNSFNILPQKFLSNHNIYFNYVIVIGAFLIFNIPVLTKGRGKIIPIFLQRFLKLWPFFYLLPSVLFFL